MRNTLFTPDDTGPRSGLRGRPVSRPSVYRETSRAPQAKDKTEGTPEGTPEGSPRIGLPANVKKDHHDPGRDANSPGKTQLGKDLRRTDADHDRDDNQSPGQTPRGQVPEPLKEKRPPDSQRETKDKKPSGDEKVDGPKSSKRPKSEDKKDSAKSSEKSKPVKKPDVEVNPELKLNTAVRDWQVNIQEVRVTNMLSDPQSIFLVFKIGDSFKKVDTLTENGKLITIDTGKRGDTFVSEIQDNINRDDSRLLTVTIRTNYKGSYADLQKEDLVISAWKYSTWLVNTYCGEVRIPLIKVVTENVCRADEIKIKHEGRMKKSLRVNYRCYFQEIWNYRLTFSDFKITNLQHNDGKPYSTNVEFALPSSGTFSIGKSVKTDTIKQDKNPLWETIKGEITFKGPLYELEDKDMDVVIRDSSGLKKGPVCSSRISLKGLSTKGSIRVPVKVTLSSNSGNKTEVRGTRGGTAKDPRDTAGKKRDDDEIGMDFYYTYLEGRVTIPEKPKYFQKGDSLILRAGGRYLCVQVGKLENIHPPETIGMVNSFVTVHWGNQRNSTRTIMDDFSPTFNEEMHFKISLDKDERDPKFYEELKNNLKSRAEITAYVWLDPKNGGFENIGYCKCTLSEIMAGFIDEKGFYDFENKAQVKKNCRVATVKKQVISSIVESSNTFLNLSFYLFPDYPADKMDVGELTKVEGDKVDPLVYKAIKDGVNSEPWKTHTGFISQVFGEDLQTFREQNFQFIFAVDQCNLTRFLPTYLDTFTMDFQPPKAPEYELSQVVTCKDVFAFVNNIPFVDEYKKSDLIASPEFTLTQNKGSQADHVVLLACLMMGCTYETQDEIGKLKQLVETYSKEMVSFENRVFVCVGTNKFSTKRELWLMTYSRDLTSVTMWDVKTALCYELKGRVSESNAKLLKKYLTYDPSKDLENTGEAILEILNKLAQDDAPEDEKQDEDESEQSSLKFDLDQILGQDNYEAIVDPELNRQLYRYTALEREDRATGGYEFMQNKAKSQMKGGHNAKNKEAIHDFFQKGKKVNSAELIPWESIELIFNHKNIWANVQYMNPTKIMYEIYNPAQWRCFLSIYNGKNEIPWLNKVGAFHNIPALEAPIDPEDIHRYEAIIMKDIKFTITQQRSALNKETRFRSPKDKLSALLKEYLKVMHVFECSKKSEKQILEDGEGVARKMKELIPRDYKLCYLPLRFSILDTERIQSIIAENFSDFFMQVKDPCMFAAACKIFPFPNKINSLRIIVCSVSKITRGEFDLSEEEADDLDDETKWDLGKTTDLGLKDEHFYHEN